MGPFPSSFENNYILLAVEYVTKWIEAVATVKDDGQTVIRFLKKQIVSRFGVPRVIITDGGSHFCNKPMEQYLRK